MDTTSKLRRVSYSSILRFFILLTKTMILDVGFSAPDMRFKLDDWILRQKIRTRPNGIKHGTKRGIVFMDFW